MSHDVNAPVGISIHVRITGLNWANQRVSTFIIGCNLHTSRLISVSSLALSPFLHNTISGLKVNKLKKVVTVIN